jgi:hypothetical protein
MTPLALLISSLRSVGREVKETSGGYSTRCPAHDDTHASLSLSESTDGKALLHCHAGCELPAILKSLGMFESQLFPEVSAPRQQIVATYDYVDENGGLLYQKVRYEPKDFRLRRSPSEWGLNGVRRVLYRLPSVIEARREGSCIYVVEGEKDADALAKLGLCATTDDAGAGARWREDATKTLAGSARVVVIPDADEAGRKRALSIMRELSGQVADLRLLELPGPGKDASDWIAAGGTRDQLESLVSGATGRTEPNTVQPQATLKPRYSFQTGPDLVREPLTNPLWLVNGLLPESGVCVIAGEPKATKTWSALEIGMALATATPAFGEYEVQAHKNVAVFLAEDGKRSIKARIAALADSRHMDQCQAVERMYFICRGQLNILEASEIVGLVDACKTIPDLGLLIMDPLRDLHCVDENDSTSMAKVTHALRAIRDEIGCAVLFVHHSAKSSKDTESRRPGQKMRGSSVIHGAIDAGIYLSKTDTDLRTYWTNEVSVEIKEGAGAGVFKLTLNLDNDEEGRARGGSWDVEKTEAKPRPSLDRARTAIVEALQSSVGPSGIKKLKVMAKCGQGVAKDALEALRADGIAIEVVEGGISRGWMLSSAAKSADPYPGDLTHTRPIPGYPPVPTHTCYTRTPSKGYGGSGYRVPSESDHPKAVPVPDSDCTDVDEARMDELRKKDTFVPDVYDKYRQELIDQRLAHQYDDDPLAPFDPNVKVKS